MFCSAIALELLELVADGVDAIEPHDLILQVAPNLHGLVAWPLQHLCIRSPFAAALPCVLEEHQMPLVLVMCFMAAVRA